MSAFRQVCEQAARAGGRVLMQMRGRIQAQEKGPKDLVTEADIASQEVIRRVLGDAFPSHGFLGEEGDGTISSLTPGGGGGKSPYCWVVDPLDGTLNYARQLPNYSVSVALRHGSRVVCGVVYDPLLDECFGAELGQGATLNGEPIRASDCNRVERALIAASLPTEVPRGSREIDRFVEVMIHAQSIRRMGSAALNLCYLATGRLDAYWATCVKVWDVAAGTLIVTEAGGTVTHPDGSAFDLDCPQFVAAATPSLHRDLMTVLGRAQGV